MITCAFENGNKATLRHVTVDALMVKNNALLLVKRSPLLVEGGKWAIPGGYLSRDERPEDAALRELQEETGWQGVNPVLFSISTSPNRKNDSNQCQNVNFAYIVSPAKEVGSHDWEETEVAWFDLSDLPSEEQFAFDHWDIIVAYKKFLINHHSLPLIW